MTDYRMSYVCTKCRKSFKREYDVSKPWDIQDGKPCPECGEPTINCGRHFKPPKKTNKDQWEKVELLITNGFPFHKLYLETGSIPYPETLAEAKAWIEQHKSKSLLQRKL
jgi:DNA-directed RNA polymerase subunit RPC12/RpoP